MQPIARLKNRSTQWSNRLRPRVTDVVVDSGTYYANIAGFNGPLSDINIWLPFNSGNSGASAVQIDKTSADILGVDPGFYINLSADITEAYPASIKVYVNIDTTAPGNQFIEMAPAPYYPGTKQLFGFSDPAAFPNQAIKIFVI